jgi:hypothetical protein
MKLRIPKRVQTRKNLPRFGEAKVGEENVTLSSKDWIAMEHPDDQLIEGGDDPSLQSTLANFILKQQETKILRESDVDGIMFDENGDLIRNQDDDGKGDTSGKYVAPGSKGGASTLENAFKDKEAENTIRVSNLTKSVTEDDLRDLFEPFGRIFRISLPRTERTEGGKTFKEPRGFAYIAYHRKEDAEKAIERLQGYGYDHLILKLEWAKATSKEGGGGGPPGGGGMDARFVSGYGKQLAQDTKEKVVYNAALR